MYFTILPCLCDLGMSDLHQCTLQFYHACMTLVCLTFTNVLLLVCVRVISGVILNGCDFLGSGN